MAQTQPLARRLSILWVCIVGLIGCTEALETGYVPRKIGASEGDRRAYYAQPFSPDSHPENTPQRAPSTLRPNSGLSR